MELSEMKSVWQAYDSRLQKSLKLNLHCLGLIQTQKVKSQLTPLIWQRAIELVLHTTAIALLLAFLVSNFSEWPYAVSALALLVFYVVAFSNCLRQLLVIKRMDYSNDIVTIQSSLVMLRSHMVNLARLSVLCIPTYLAYPMVVSKAIADLDLEGLSFMDIRAGYDGNWWTVQLIATIMLAPLCIAFYRQVSYKNIHIGWVKKIILKFSGHRVTRAMELMNELESLKKEAA